MDLQFLPDPSREVIWSATSGRPIFDHPVELADLHFLVLLDYFARFQTHLPINVTGVVASVLGTDGFVCGQIGPGKGLIAVAVGVRFGIVDGDLGFDLSDHFRPPLVSPRSESSCKPGCAWS